VRGPLLYGLGVAALFGVLIGGTVHGSSGRQLAVGVVAALVAFFALYTAGWVYDRWIVRNRKRDDRTRGNAGDREDHA
jgi:hypothetical protein